MRALPAPWYVPRMTTTSAAHVVLKRTGFVRTTLFGYGVHASYIVTKHERGGYSLYVREHVTTSGVVHSIGQPDLWTDYNDTLAQTRQIIADVEAATVAAGCVSYDALCAARRATSARIMADCAAVCARYDAMISARS